MPAHKSPGSAREDCLHRDLQRRRATLELDRNASDHAYFGRRMPVSEPKVWAWIFHFPDVWRMQIAYYAGTFAAIPTLI
jgi:hypothetical protein